MHSRIFVLAIFCRFWLRFKCFFTVDGNCKKFTIHTLKMHQSTTALRNNLFAGNSTVYFVWHTACIFTRKCIYLFQQETSLYNVQRRSRMFYSTVVTPCWLGNLPNFYISGVKKNNNSFPMRIKKLPHPSTSIAITLKIFSSLHKC